MVIKLYKVVVLGDGGVGKTAITIQFCLSHFVETYDPTIEDSYRKQVTVDNQDCLLEVLDTAGQEEYIALRDQWVRDGDGFVLVYSITSPASFTRVASFHALITRAKDTAQVPCIVVGNKSDCEAERQVPQAQGAQLAESLRCAFLESSAKTCINVDEAFYSVVRQIRGFDQWDAAGPHGEQRRNSRGKNKKKRGKCIVS